MDLLEFLNKNYYVVVPALWVIGYALKQTPKIPNWTIIWILLGLSLGFGIITFGLKISAIINGIIAAGVAVFGHQMIKQTFEAGFVKRIDDGNHLSDSNTSNEEKDKCKDPEDI